MQTTKMVNNKTVTCLHGGEKHNELFEDDNDYHS
jgi:hypothetical protein